MFAADGTLDEAGRAGIEARAPLFDGRRSTCHHARRLVGGEEIDLS